MKNLARACIGCLAAVWGGGGCGAEPASPASNAAAPPAAVSAGVREGELATVTLTPAAIAALGIETGVISPRAGAATRTAPGTIVAPPGASVSVAAPIAGSLREGDVALVAGATVAAGTTALRLVPLAPVDRDVRAQARRQSSTTQARLEVAKARVTRLESLMKDRAASARALEEAKGELDAAQAEHDAAVTRERALGRAPLSADVTLRVTAPLGGIVRTLSASPGQVVAAGAPLFEIMPADALWLRVSLSPAELQRIDRDASAWVGRVGDPQRWEARPVDAPPSADALAGTLDRFYALPIEAELHAPGERVEVELPERDGAAAWVPAGAVVRDFDGGAWVYTCDGEGHFRRQRVEPVQSRDDGLALARGPAVGTCVVTVGAAELLGAEFGVAH